jgi:3'-phosphoadenosine 5'-phosphosulfate sulfotransferase (PAPS reductase)/FAD synthetase
MRAHFAQKHMDDAAKAVAAVTEKRIQDSEDNQRAYERFYNTLALFSGGTIALSVTYLGYLKSATKPVLHEGWLVGSWLSLLICLACSIFYGFFLAHYGHFFRNREYCEALKKKYETEMNEVTNLNVVNLQTESEIEGFMAPRREAARTSGENAKWNNRREKVYERAWIWSGRLARLEFLVGLVLLLAFAVKNM